MQKSYLFQIWLDLKALSRVSLNEIHPFIPSYVFSLPVKKQLPSKMQANTSQSSGGAHAASTSGVASSRRNNTTSSGVTSRSGTAGGHVPKWYKTSGKYLMYKVSSKHIHVNICTRELSPVYWSSRHLSGFRVLYI